MRRVAVPLTLTPQSVAPRGGRPIALVGPTMGVAWSVQALLPPGVSETQVRAAAQATVDAVVAQMSPWEPDSDISRFNRAPAGAWVAVPADLMTVVGAALAMAAQSGGAFDPTVGAAVDLWGFGPPGAVSEPPARAALDASPADWTRLEVDAAGGRLRQPGGLRLDLSGIAKGFGVDRVALALERLGVADHLVEIGGELRGAGVSSGGEPWWVDIEPHPEAPFTEPPVLVALHGLSIASSGDWRRAFSAGGRRYSHTLDPRTCAPVEGPVAAATVLHPDCMQADALCTALVVLGAEAEAFCIRHGVAAWLALREAEGWRELITPAFQALLE